MIYSEARASELATWAGLRLEPMGADGGEPAYALADATTGELLPGGLMTLAQVQEAARLLVRADPEEIPPFIGTDPTAPELFEVVVPPIPASGDTPPLVPPPPY